MKATKRGFTLIELMVVLAIIVILMTILLPGIQSAVITVKKKQTAELVMRLTQVVSNYEQTFTALPPSSLPGNIAGWDYPRLRKPDGELHKQLFTVNSDACGGEFLFYFIYGADGTGWHRKSPLADLGGGADMPDLSAEWDFPTSLNNAYEFNRDLAMFTDAWGPQMAYGGYIMYSTADPRQRTDEGRRVYDVQAIHDPYNETGIKDASDGSRPQDHFRMQLGIHSEQDMLDQLGGVDKDFVLISGGPDGRFGYYTNTSRGYQATLKGTCDDIANFDIRGAEDD